MLQNSYADNFAVAHQTVSDKKLYYSDNGSTKNIEDIISILHNYIRN